MATVRKRKWVSGGEERTSWVVDYFDAGRKRRQESFQRKKDADQRLQEIQRQLHDGIHIPRSTSLTIAEAAENWIDACQAGRNGREAVEASTLRQYRGHVEHHINPLFGSRRLSDLTRKDLNAFRDLMLQGDEGQGIAPRSRALAAKIMTSLRSILSDAGVSHSVISKGGRIQKSKRRRKRVDIPSRSEMKKIFRKLDEWASQDNKRSSKAWRRWRALIKTAVFTGMRASELRGLHWEDVSLDEFKIDASRRADENNVIGPLKSETSYRTILIPGDLVRTLKQWRIECPPGDLVFPNWRGNIESTGNIHRRAWKPLLDVFGMNHTFHSLRHFYASMLIADGATPNEVKAALGHSSIQVTFDIYGHLFPEDDTARQARADRLANDLVAS